MAPVWLLLSACVLRFYVLPAGVLRVNRFALVLRRKGFPRKVAIVVFWLFTAVLLILILFVLLVSVPIVLTLYIVFLIRKVVNTSGHLEVLLIYHLLHSYNSLVALKNSFRLINGTYVAWKLSLCPLRVRFLPALPCMLF